MFQLCISIFIFFITTAKQYIQTPSFVFKVYDNTTTSVSQSYLSPDSDQLMIILYDIDNTSKHTQEIFYFNSTKACSTQIDINSQYFYAWPLKTKGLLRLYNQNIVFLTQNEICSKPTPLITIQKQNYQTYALRNTTDFSYITILSNVNRVSQYDLNSGTYLFMRQGALFRNFTLSDSQTIFNIVYSPDQKYLFAESNSKVVIYDSHTLERLREIIDKDNFHSLVISGFNDGKCYLRVRFLDYHVPTFYFINESTTRLICNVIDILDVINEDFFAGVCTQDNLIVTVAKINGQQNIITYNTTNGDAVQNFTINLKGKPIHSTCNDNYLVIIDDTGYAYIFSYNHTQSKPDPQPKPDPKNKEDITTIVWVILIIAIMQTILIFALGFFVCCKRKQGYNRNMNLLAPSQIED